MVEPEVAKRAILHGLLAGFVVAPIVLFLIELAKGEVLLPETLAGVVIGTAFFAITAVATWRFRDFDHLQAVVICSYVVKIVPLVLLAAFVPLTRTQRVVVGGSVLLSALLYLGAQTVTVALRGRDQKGPPARETSGQD